jgi:N-methylhydantoinase B
MGDFDAQIAANAIGQKRVVELAERYGAQKVQDVMAALLDYSEARMRASLREIPDGVYVGEDAVDDDGISEDHLPVKATVTIKGDSAEIDFTGTAAQVRRNLNAPFAATVSAALSCLKAALTSPDIPFNAGSFRPIRVTAPKGSMLNPNHPAPVRARMEVCSRAWNAIMKALSLAVPEKVIACGFDTTTSFVLSHLGETGWSVYLEIYGGGFGAGLNTDGCDGVDNPLSNCSNTPVEALDQDFSFFRVIGYALRTDSCGRGKWRGGLGFTRSFEVLKDNVRIALYSDRFRRSADGLFGGRGGATGFCEIRRGQEVIRLCSKSAIDLRRGDIVTLGLGGGGGYGNPSERSRAKIAEDVEDGVISANAAREWVRP